MAREQRKDVDYFPHECVHGRKMHIIEAKYGNDGYTAWFKLLEQLGKANDHYIDISEEMTLMFLTSVFKLDEEKTMLILNDLSKLEAIDKYLFEEFKVIYSHKFVESVKDAYRNRKGAITEYSVILNQIRLKNGQTSASLTPKEVNLTEVILKEEKSKVKDIKEEETKEKKIKEDIVLFEKEPKTPPIKIPKFNFKKALLNYGFNEKLVDDWLSVRKTKRATNTETAFDSFIREIESRSSNINDMLQICVTNSWSGFKYKWVDNLNNTQNGKQQQSGKTNAEIYNDAINSETGIAFNWGKG